MFSCSQRVLYIHRVCGSHTPERCSPGALFAYFGAVGCVSVSFFSMAHVEIALTDGSTGLFGSPAVVLRAARNYEAGEEFLVSYGPKGAAGYLEENGYVLSWMAFGARVVDVSLTVDSSAVWSCGSRLSGRLAEVRR